MIPFKERSDGVCFQVKVLPRSSRCAVAGMHGEALKIKITAPPVEGKANEELVRFLATRLGIRAAQISIAAGDHSQIKTISVTGITGGELQASLDGGEP